MWTTAGLHPHHAAELGRRDRGRDRAPRGAARAAWRSARPGSTGSATARRATRSSPPSTASSRSPARLELPVVIHCREATDDCFAILAAEAPPTVVLHCFAAVERLDEAVERGWYCSFAGNVTYGSAVDLQDAARRVPDELLLLETDAPYLSPVPHRGRPNEPAYVMDTLRFVAELRGTAPDALAAVVDAARQPGVPAPGGLSGGGGAARPVGPGGARDHARHAARPALPGRPQHRRRRAAARRPRPAGRRRRGRARRRRADLRPRRARARRARHRARPAARGATPARPRRPR